MLDKFTWPQFLIVISAATTLWYLLVITGYYRKEINLLFRGRMRNPFAEDDPTGAAESLEEAEEVMGQPLAAGSNTITAEEMRFAPLATAAEPELAAGAMPGLLEEFQTLINLIADTEEPKEEFETLFKFIIGKCSAATRNRYREAINEYIIANSQNKFSFEVTDEDLNTLWDAPVPAGETATRIMELVIVFLLFRQTVAWAQDGNAGINEATNQVKGYFEAGTSLMYAVGAIVGLIGAVKVYQKWNAGEPDTGKVASAWFGSCIFLVVVATVLKSFFGV